MKNLYGARPIIGLLGISKGGSPIGGLEPDFLRAWADAVTKGGGLAVAFTAAGVKSGQRLISGWAWNAKGRRWVPGRYPLPQVVYERMISRRGEAKARPKLAFLRQNGTRVFNGGYLDKERIYRLLQQNPAMAALLPETQPGRFDLLPALLETHGTVYLKPRRSCEGYGILRIDRVSPSVWRLRYRIGGRNQVVSGAPPAVTARAQRLMGQRPFVLQQGIDLVRYEGRPCDFRAMVTRDGKGAWRLTAVGAKVAGAGSITTHVRTGGRAVAAPAVLRQFGERETEVVDALHRAAVAVSAYVGDRLPGLWADFGLDLAVDRGGRVWVLEVNSKCGTQVFAAAPGRHLWIQRLAEYCLLLATGGEGNG